jgi:predicted porin
MFFHKYKSPAVMLALAAAGLAHAQSNVSLYGTIDLAFGSFQQSGASGSTANAHLTKVDSNLMTTSFIGFKGSEDLGGGLKAGFALESFLRPDTGASGRTGTDTFWARAANVYLQSDLGKVTIGRQINLPYLQIATFNPFGGAFGLSPAVRLTYGAWGNDKGDSGWSNAVSYNSPVFGGFSGTVQVQTGESASKAERTSYGLGGSYVNGPFAAAVSWQMLRSAEAPKSDFAAGQRQNFGLANVSYDAGFAKFFGQYGQYKNSGFTTNAEKIDTWLYQIGASVPVTAQGKVLASYGQSKEKPVEGGTTPMTIHGILTIAYDYNLSKRTDTYVALMSDNEGKSGYKVGYTYAVGLRHSF